MHTMFVAMILAVGADQDQFGSLSTPTMARSASPSPDVAGPYHYDPPRDPQEADGLVRGFFMYCCAWFQPMPQTCYTPHYGCYPGNGRDFRRPTAFHGYYYRQAYNYRPLFEYPWQAGTHEPLPFEVSSGPAPVASPPGSPPAHPEVIETPSANPLHSAP